MDLSTQCGGQTALLALSLVLHLVWDRAPLLNAAYFRLMSSLAHKLL